MKYFKVVDLIIIGRPFTCCAFFRLSKILTRKIVQLLYIDTCITNYACSHKFIIIQYHLLIMIVFIYNYLAQWRTVGVWRPGQEVELALLFAIFLTKISKLVDPKLISVIFIFSQNPRIIFMLIFIHFPIFASIHIHAH